MGAGTSVRGWGLGKMLPKAKEEVNSSDELQDSNKHSSTSPPQPSLVSHLTVKMNKEGRILIITNKE